MYEFDRMERALAILKTLDDEMPLSYVRILMKVINATKANPRDGVVMRDLQDLIDMDQSSVSRAVGALSDKRRAASGGYGLVETYEYPFDRRVRLVRLTDKGLAYANRLRKVLADKEE